MPVGGVNQQGFLPPLPGMGMFGFGAGLAGGVVGLAMVVVLLEERDKARRG